MLWFETWGHSCCFLFVMWSSRTECGMMLHSGSRNIGNARLFDPRQSAFAIAMIWQCIVCVVLHFVTWMWRDVYFHVVSVVFSACWIWSEVKKLLQKGHCSALWPDCSKAVDDLRAVENFIVGTKHLVNLNRLRCGSGPESLAYLRHSSMWKSSRSIVSSVLHLFYVVNLHSCRNSFTARLEPYFSEWFTACATGTRVTSIGQITSNLRYNDAF